MDNVKKYDTCIIGGGLAGLTLSIQLANLGYSVALFEKEEYPFHKVCGEYISMESWNFLEELGLPLSDLKLPLISQLMVTAPNGNRLQQTLPLGGFGIRRYRCDAALKEIAEQNGVTVFENCKVNDPPPLSTGPLIYPNTATLNYRAGDSNERKSAFVVEPITGGLATGDGGPPATCEAGAGPGGAAAAATPPATCPPAAAAA